MPKSTQGQRLTICIPSHSKTRFATLIKIMINRRNLVVFLTCLPTQGLAFAQSETTLMRWAGSILPPFVMTALEQIEGDGRKLLAIRSYLRIGKNLDERWSWTDAEIEAFQHSREHELLTNEIEAIKKHFAQNNEGFTLYIHSKIRSLDRQISMWNTNKSVESAASAILAAWTEARMEEITTANSEENREAIDWLKSYSPDPRPTLAAPGLTRHGRASAIDFQIMKNGEIIAGANSAQIKTIWQAEGWDERLIQSIKAAGPSFKGPLKRPYEPWHFDYFPSSEQGSSE